MVLSLSCICSFGTACQIVFASTYKEKTPPYLEVSLLFLKQIRVSTCSYQIQNMKFILIFLTIYQQPIWLNVAFSKSCKLASKGMVLSFRWQWDIICKIEDHFIELILRKVSFSCKFQIFLELMSKYDFSHTTGCLRGNPQMIYILLPCLFSVPRQL